MALSSWSGASLRYRIARALLMASQIPRNRTNESTTRKGNRFRAVLASRAGRPVSFFKSRPVGFLNSASGRVNFFGSI